jgi:transposase
MKKKRERRQFDAAFKIEAVRRMHERLALHVSLAEISRDLGLRPDLLRSWSRQLAKHAGQSPHDVFPGEGRLPSAEEEVRQLRRELETVKLERDFLKKASAYFARESR